MPTEVPRAKPGVANEIKAEPTGGGWAEASFQPRSGYRDRRRRRELHLREAACSQASRGARAARRPLPAPRACAPASGKAGGPGRAWNRK